MCDEWMRVIKLPLTPDQFRELPRHPAYRYEYVEGQACLSPRARHYHALLGLKPLDVSPSVPVRRVRAGDLKDLVRLFAAAFGDTQPFAGLGDQARREAARTALERTRRGGDGPWVRQASFVATETGAGRHAPGLCGAVLITLLPPGDPCVWDSYHWTEPPPPDCVERRLGRPHLTWVFVAPSLARRGIGTALLSASARELLALGFTDLLSTFMAGNESSMLWHWRNSFRLLPCPGSMRRWLPRREAPNATARDEA
jgi:GNAT superfamily N-acetyltransferase